MSKSHICTTQTKVQEGREALKHLLIVLGVLFSISVISLETVLLFYCPILTLLIGAITSSFDNTRIARELRKTFGFKDEDIHTVLRINSILTFFNVILMGCATVEVIKETEQFFQNSIDPDL